MGLEAATYIDDLVSTNPVVGDNVFEGDDHLRLIKATLQATFPSFDRPFYHDTVTTGAADVTLDATDDRSVQDIDASGGVRTITLPTSPSAGYEVTISKSDSSSNAVTVARGGTNTINGTTTYSLPRQYSAAKFKYIGAGLWLVIAATYMRGPTTSVDDELVLFSGTSGDLLKRASTTGILKAASGVLSAAVEGTDYYAPGGTEVALADGGTGASLVDPGADRILFWDDSAGGVTWLEVGSGLSLAGTVLSASGGGSGDVVGPASATDNALARFDTTTGKLLQDSGVTLSDTAVFAGVLTVGFSSGGSLNFDSGDVTVTHSANALTFAGATNGYLFSNALLPETTDGAALGSTANMWSDIFIAAGGVINFDNGDLTLTHAANSLTITGGILVLDAGATVGGSLVKTAGKETIFVPAAAMVTRTTNGAASGTTELTTNDVMLASYDFDQTTEEGVGFWIAMPKSWDESTVTFKPFWTAASGSGGVVWGLAAYAFSDDDALDTAVSGQQTSTDTLIATNDMHIGPESSAITIGGTPAEGDMVYFEITREVANGSDTLSADAKLLGVHVYFTTNAATDA
ncbi:MAG: hypothetical protein IPK54_10075 [Dokdonella sp.]|uniref:hypothetical protein n=1 Tax=Dokdonella sp. TaxID=2291710 RepID=UPI0025BDBD29|nr:hypothetical protein [Dokdonella sp.]MBK8123878.1 hypothetical protein [Dokdonella sp.]